MTITGGIQCEVYVCELTITSTSSGETMGKLTSNAGSTAAGIGGNDAKTAGTIIIKGGEISATGGNNATGSGAGIGGGRNGTGGTIEISGDAKIKVAQGGKYAAGIGGGAGGAGGIINIKGGKITSTGGFYGAGIGGGNNGGDGGEITITGGEISATGGDAGAGIGGGYGGTGGDITILGGTISATGTNGGAGIGGGLTSGGHGGDGGTIKIEGGTITEAKGGLNAAGIGGGSGGTGGEITIKAGIIESTGGNGGAGIGGGFSGSSGGTIKIEGGIISATGGNEGAGIGGGSGGDGGIIKIEGGTISAHGPESDSGIGKGQDGHNTGLTKITGGSINATFTYELQLIYDGIRPDPKYDDAGSVPVYLNTLTVSEFPNSPVTAFYNSSYGINGVVTDSDGKVYFYLPATSGDELLAVSFDEIDNSEEYYGATYQRVALNIYEKTLEHLQLDEPIAAIDYENEILTGLKPDTNYKISISEELAPESLSLKPLSAAISNGAGTTPIDESWIGNDVDIVQTRIVPYGDSEAQVLHIPARLPVSSELAALIQTAPESEGENGKVSGLKVGMAYSTDPNAAPDEWIDVDSEDDLVLPPGTYYFRKAATVSDFATEAVEVLIPAFQAPVAPDEPADPDSSAAPLGLAETGLNLDLAYLMVLLLLMVTVPQKK